MDQYTQTPITPARTINDVIVRSGVPFFLFGLVLSGLLVVSRAELLPRLTRINVEGEPLQSDQLADVEQRINDDIAAAEQRRADLVRPVRDASYDTLKEYKRTLMTPLEVQAFIQKAIDQADPPLEGIVFQHIRVDATTGEVSVHGDVRGVGSRSMTVLAQFVDLLRANPSVHALQTPAFVREDEPGIGFHSPFSFNFVLGNTDTTASIDQ